jgi:hypothetical protein
MKDEAAYWKKQAELSFQDNDLLSEGINQVYLALGLTEKFEVCHNPAHNQLEKILEKVRSNG